MDKRDLSDVFRERLRTLLQRSGANQSAFAGRIGIDRSALSQLLSGATTRLPRAETLLNIAAEHKISLDWLLGLSQDEGLTGEIRQSLELEEAPDGFDHTLLAKWHAEAAGAKVRYVPTGIPDVLKTEALIAYETRDDPERLAVRMSETQYRVDYNRRFGTDMESCMPRQTLELFASGQGLWSEMPAVDRHAQLVHMARLADELYPAFRLYLYDGRARFSVPYSIFGPYRAAIYAGDMYIVLNATEPVRILTRHFENLIRAADINAHEASAFIARLAARAGQA